MNISAGPFLYLPCTRTVSLKLNPDLIENWRFSFTLLKFLFWFLWKIYAVHRLLFSNLCHYHLPLQLYLLYFSDASWDSISERVYLYHRFYFLYYQLRCCFQCAFIFLFFCLQVSYCLPNDMNRLIFNKSFCFHKAPR